MHPTVGLLLVVHDGASWLPTVIEGVRGQQVPLSQVVAVDTGSQDNSVDLLEQVGVTVVRADRGSGFPGAVELGTRHLSGQNAPEWIWILHDDSTPDPGALAALMAAADRHHDVDVFGPKLREWPSLRRLLEMGVTITGTGRRETGLERGEYDQGQHDNERQVLAVNTAGMLVRRMTLAKLGGFDPKLPMFGNDIDFGWRAANAGIRTLVVPDAVVFHAEAAHRGVRRTELTVSHTHYQERRAALYTLLANGRALSLPFRYLRLAVGTLLRMVGLFAVRDVRSALDELAAMVSVFSRPGQIFAARRARRKRGAAGGAARPLLASWWVPYRHGLDFVGDVASALTDQASDVAERRRIAKAEADPSSFAARRQVAIEDADEDELLAENGWMVRFFTNPVAVILTIVAILGVIGARSAFGSVAGGGLSPVPDGATDWWALHLRTWHPIGQGTDVPAPPYVFPMAVLATALFGQPGLALSAVLVLSFPVALWGAWRLLRVVGRLVSHRGAPRPLVLWGATAYALIAPVSGAWGDGRLGPVVVGAVLPWLVHAALGFADPDADRRWRAAWRTGLLLTIVIAFAPSAWLFVLVLLLMMAAIGRIIARGVLRDRSIAGPPLVALAVPVVLMLPWWLSALLNGAGSALLLDPGPLPAPALDGVDVALGRLPEWGAPWWLGLVLPALALLALLPTRTRIPVLVCWLVATVAAVVALVLSVLDLDLPAGTTAPGSGFVLIVVQGAAVLAAVIGAQGMLLGGLSSWRRPIAWSVSAVALVSTVAGVGWFLVSGAGAIDDGLEDSATSVVPSYLLDESVHSIDDGVLVLRGSTDAGLHYTVLRGGGITMGEDEIVATTPEDDEFSGLVHDLAADPDAGVTDRLAESGIAYIVMPEPVDAAVSDGIDASGGVSQASIDPPNRAWQLDAEVGDVSVDQGTSWLRVALLVIHIVGLLVVAVLCLPTLERRRR